MYVRTPCSSATLIEEYAALPLKSVVVNTVLAVSFARVTLPAARAPGRTAVSIFAQDTNYLLSASLTGDKVNIGATRALNAAPFDEQVAFVGRASWLAVSSPEFKWLLDAGLTRSADTVLTFATQRLGGGRQVAAELAELKGALGMWESSATNWRQAMTYAPFLESSAIFVLGAANGVARDTIRGILAADPADLSVRRILAGLEMRWTSAREAWNALRVLTPTDSVVEAWLEFAADAEERESWLVARDAYAAGSLCCD